MNIKLVHEFNIKGSKSISNKGWEHYGIGFSYASKENMRLFEFTAVIFTVGVGWIVDGDLVADFQAVNKAESDDEEL